MISHRHIYAKFTRKDHVSQIVLKGLFSKQQERKSGEMCRWNRGGSLSVGVQSSAVCLSCVCSRPPKMVLAEINRGAIERIAGLTSYYEYVNGKMVKTN